MSSGHVGWILIHVYSGDVAGRGVWSASLSEEVPVVIRVSGYPFRLVGFVNSS